MAGAAIKTKTIEHMPRVRYRLNFVIGIIHLE